MIGQAAKPLIDRYVVKPAGWADDLKVKLAAAQAGSHLFRAAAFGDSVGQGYGPSLGLTHGWLDLWAAEMKTRVGDGGTGFRGTQYGPGATTYLGTVPLTWSAGWTAAVGGTGQLLYSNTPDAYVEWTAMRGTHLRVHWFRSAGLGRIGVKVDGVDLADINTAGANGIMSTSYTLSAGDHTVRLTGKDALYVFLTGIETFNDAGFVLDNFSYWGQTSGLVSAEAWGASGAGETVGEYSIGSRPHLDLLISGMGGNDQVLATDVGIAGDAETFQTNLRVLQAWATFVTADVATLGYIAPAGTDPGLINWAYAREARAYYEAIGAAFLDVFGYFRGSAPYAYAKGWLSAADNPHPNDAGTLALFELLRKVL